ncbi:MAG: DUF4863 family protein [Planctomycetota bacterium]
MTADLLKTKLQPLCAELAKLDFSTDTPTTVMNQKYPATGPVMQEITRLATEGLKAGWLCDKVNGAIKFSRVLKPLPEHHGFSVDAVYMPDAAGPTHTHPKGELSFCIALEGSPQFDGYGPGWALYKSGTTHTPTVKGGTMLILYWLPEGSVEWKK